MAHSSAASEVVAERESCAFPAGARRRQAACEIRGKATTLPHVLSSDLPARTSSRISHAIGTQLPQQAPHPVRMVSSAMPLQPAWAAWRMSRSVTPLQTQTYMEVGKAPKRERALFRHE